MKNLLHNQQVDIEKRCDFMEKKKIDTIDSDSSGEEAPPKDHPMLKYKQLTAAFNQKQYDANQDLAKKYFHE